MIKEIVFRKLFQLRMRVWDTKNQEEVGKEQVIGSDVYVDSVAEDLITGSHECCPYVNTMNTPKKSENRAFLGDLRMHTPVISIEKNVKTAPCLHKRVCKSGAVFNYAQPVFSGMYAIWNFICRTTTFITLYKWRGQLGINFRYNRHIIGWLFYLCHLFLICHDFYVFNFRCIIGLTCIKSGRRWSSDDASNDAHTYRLLYYVNRYG